MDISLATSRNTNLPSCIINNLAYVPGKVDYIAGFMITTDVDEAFDMNDHL